MGKRPHGRMVQRPRRVHPRSAAGGGTLYAVSEREPSHAKVGVTPRGERYVTKQGKEKMKADRAVFGFFLAVAGAAASSEAPDWLPENNPDAKYLIEMERRWVNSRCTGENLDKTIMAEGFLGTAPDGRRFKNSDEFDLDPRSVVPSAISVHDEDCRMDYAKVRLFRPDLAVVYGMDRTTRASDSGKNTVRCLVWTDTWMKHGRTWLIIAAQYTIVRC